MKPAPCFARMQSEKDAGLAGGTAHEPFLEDGKPVYFYLPGMPYFVGGAVGATAVCRHCHAIVFFPGVSHERVGG